MPTSDDREQRVNEVIADYLAACEAGSPPDRDELLARHPDIADSLAAFLADHAHMRRAIPAPGPRPRMKSATLPPNGPRPVAPPLGSIKYFGDYELLEEIARGGMGVVYRARQVSLNRVVAVKMILAGAYAGDRDVQRFRAEAEAAANLDHPNILPIYEVGEHEGQQYFSMKLVSWRRPPLLNVLLQKPQGLQSLGLSRCYRKSVTRSITRTSAAFCTATSSRPTSCSTPMALPTSPTSDSQRKWRATVR